MAPVRASPAVVEGAVVFTDIIGFTEFTALRGDEEALALLASHERVVRDLMPVDARLVKDLGDGYLLWFPDACAALDTCLRLQDELQAGEEPLWIRIGLHWGRQMQRGDDVVGHDVNVAARIMDVAGPGEVLLSDAALALTEGKVPGVTFEELGPVVMRGIPEPVGLYRATARPG